MALAKLYTKPGHLIRRLQQIAVGAFMAEMKDTGLNPVQYAILSALTEMGAVDIKRLADAVALDRSTLGASVARMAERGLLTQSAQASDRRAKLLSVTTEGCTLLAAVEPVVMASQTAMLARISEDERLGALRHRQCDGSGRGRSPLTLDPADLTEG